MSHKYYGPNWSEIRSEVIEENGGQCVVCFSEKNLEVHHRKPLKEFDSHEQANDKDNLAPLCKRCHSRIESIQDPHTRRGIDSFMAELEAEDVDTPESYIEFLCYNEVQSSEAGASICEAEGCFYPVVDDDFTCPSCGHFTDDKYISYEDRVCIDCGEVFRNCVVHESTFHHQDEDVDCSPDSIHTIGESGWECENCGEQFKRKGDKLQHNYHCGEDGERVEFNEYVYNEHGEKVKGSGWGNATHSKKPSRSDGSGQVCPKCAETCKSEDDTIKHMLNSHELSRIEARKLLRKQTE